MSDIMFQAGPLRFLVALFFALFVGQAPLVLAGDGVVICGNPGTVAYDFEKGAPAAPGPDIGWCDHCVAAPMAALPPAFFEAPRTHDVRGAAWATTPAAAEPVSLSPLLPRGPPAPVLSGTNFCQT